MFVRPKPLCGRAISRKATSTLLVVFACFSFAQAPDNTATNKGQRPTADSQSGHPSDRQITAHIRRDLIADKQLSTYGHNIKIITQGGKVTLKGPVHSQDEKQAIEARAEGIAGPGNVTDQLTVKQ